MTTQTHSSRYELHQMRHWRHRETSATASLYGACPWTNEHDKPNWSVESCGWGYTDTRNGTHHGKHGTSLDDTIAQVNALNLRQAKRDESFRETLRTLKALNLA